VDTLLECVLVPDGPLYGASLHDNSLDVLGFSTIISVLVCIFRS
jgi:hypothetical protein